MDPILGMDFGGVGRGMKWGGWGDVNVYNCIAMAIVFKTAYSRETVLMLF